jgi:hypothetical protein
MIKEEFSFKDPYLHYYVGLNQIRLLQKVFELDRLIQITSILQTQFSETVIQFFNDKYILNQNHIFIIKKLNYRLRKLSLKNRCYLNQSI